MISLSSGRAGCRRLLLVASIGAAALVGADTWGQGGGGRGGFGGGGGFGGRGGQFGAASQSIDSRETARRCRSGSEPRLRPLDTTTALA